MRIAVSHITEYPLEKPANFTLHQVRLMPKSSAQQEVISWTVSLEYGAAEAVFDDQHGNDTRLYSYEGEHAAIRIISEGIVDTNDRSGVYGAHKGCAPLWLYLCATELTALGEGVSELLRKIGGAGGGALEKLHALNQIVADSVVYLQGATNVGTTAEEAVKLGCGVCQDHSHIFLAGARELGFPARYVSGYLAVDGRNEHEACHAWAEAHVDGIGWVGFDPSNRQSPDHRYIRVACGQDYASAAPVRGLVIGGGASNPIVTLQIQQ